MAVDGSGNVIVTGQSFGSGGTGSTGIDYATVKYSGAGVPLWTNRYNNGFDYGTAVAVDGSGGVFVTGYSHGSGSGYDYATIKYSSAGVPLWTNRYNGPGNTNDQPFVIAVDGSGNVFVTGWSFGSGSGYDYATVKYSGTGVPLWTNRYNGPGNGNDIANAIAMDGSGNVFVTGHSLGSGSGYDYATVKYSGAGLPLWTNRYNGPGTNNDRGYALVVDGSGNVFVTGSSYFGSGTGSDYVTVKYSGGGVPLWTNRYSGPGINIDSGLALAVDGSGNVFVTGESWGSGGNYYVTIKYSGVSAPAAPVISAPPQSQTVQAGANVTFSVTADGALPLSYQWRKNGVNISGAINATLTLNSVGAGNSGGYSVVVFNPYGSITSATASLAVVTDGANGNPPAQVSIPPIPSKPAGKDSLVVITHGWEPLQPNADLSWMTAMSNAIQSRVPGNWAVTNFVWLDYATFPYPDLVLAGGATKGQLYGKQLAGQGWSHIHFISHSAGAALIESAAGQIPRSTTVHCTFLDPFLGLAPLLQYSYGANANWADCYFTQDGTAGWTSGGLSHAYNVDVNWADPTHRALPYGSGFIAFSTHSYSHDFYTATVTNTDSAWCATGHGFAFSAEAGGENQWASHPIGNNNNPVVLCGPPGAIPTPTLPVAIVGIIFDQVSHAVSDTASAIVSGAGFLLSSAPLVFAPQASGKTIRQPASGANTPAWLAAALTITSAVSFVQFDAAFTDTNAAEGLLTVYWNTNQIGMVDERAASPGLQTYRFALPGMVTNGLYTLSFRLDSFTNSSSIAVTNVSTGYIGLTNPIALSATNFVSNATPVLTLTADAGFNYLVQASTNMVDWTPFAVLLNTNGAVQFSDPAITNLNRRFYRAVSP